MIQPKKAIILISLFCLAGCERGTALWSSPEDKINAAYPVSATTLAVHSSLLKDASAEQAKAVERQLNSRLKIRALDCAKGYVPPFYASISDVRKKISSTSCFAERDMEIGQWLGLKRAGYLLAKPALRPTPQKPPAFLVADSFITSVRFAQQAAVALIETQQSVSIADFESTRPMFRESLGAMIGPISPNGRLFVTGESSGNVLRVRESETGSTVVELPMVRPYQFHWLDSKVAMFVARDSSKTVLLDFETGQQVVVQGIAQGFNRAAPVPDAEGEYVLMTHSGVTKIQLVRSQSDSEVKLIADKPAPGMACALNNAGQTSDGTRYFCASSKLSIVTLKTMDIQSVALEPFYFQTGVPTPNPDLILVRGYVASAPNSSRNYFYSIANQTMTIIDRDNNLSSRYENVNSIQRQAVINGHLVEVLGDLPKLDAVSAQQVSAQAQELVNQQKLLAADPQPNHPAVNSPGSTSVASKSPPKGPLVDLAKEAQIHAVGVYQGNGNGAKNPNGRTTGYVEVRVRRTAKPIVLVLSSYEPVRWMLNTEPGANLTAVVVSGYHPSQVVGAGAAPVIVNGSVYAYKPDSSEYRALNQSVFNLTGRDIGLFQGRYDGGQFSVGTASRW